MIEKSDIYPVLDISVPIKWGSWAFMVVILACSIVDLEVRVRTCTVSFADSSCSVINIEEVGNCSDSGSKTEESERPDAIFLKNIEVSVETSSSLNHSDLEVREGYHFRIHQVVSLCVSGVSNHDVCFRAFISHGNSRNHVSSKINTKDKNSGERERDLGEDKNDERSDFRNV